MTTPRKGAPELSVSQASKEATHNEALRYMEQGADYYLVGDKDLTAPPGSPSAGDAYIVAAGATGAWAGHDGELAFYLSTSWNFIAPRDGTRAWAQDESEIYRYDAASSPNGWVLVVGGGGTGTAGTLDYDTDGALAANSDAKIATQKATKTYVDAKVAGLSWKQAVRAATTSAHTLATDYENGDVIDGVTLATGDRVLIKNQASATENGIYVVNASGAPTRASDADSGAELVNASVYVSEGTTNADTQWTCSTNATITIGATNITFAQLTSGGTALQPANNLSDVSNPVTAGANIRPVESLIIAVGDETTAITTGTSKVTFRMPYAFTVTAVRGSLSTAQTSGGQVIVDVNEGGVSIISTKLLFDNGSKTTVGSSPQPVISDSSLADDAEITIDIDNVGDGTAKGLKVTLIGHRT